MALYTFAQLEGLWKQAGGSAALEPIMAAIALAESHPQGDPTHADSNATGGVGEKGLWQINPHAWGNLATYDPAGNARAAVHVESVQGLSAWSTFNNGAYKHFLGSAKAVIPPSGTGQAPGTTTAAGRGSGGGGLQGTGGGGAGAAAASSAAQAAEAITDIGQTSSSGGWQSDLRQAILTLDPLAGVPQAITALSLPFDKFAQALDWLFVPSHWVRILAGIGGAGMVLSGVVVLAVSGQDKPVALPLGIALTGGGAVLLFVAFHNLDPNIKTVGEAVSHVQELAQAGAFAKLSPAGAVSGAGAP